MHNKVASQRVRGKGKAPAKVHVNIRLPSEALEFYKSFPNYTGKMRAVLVDYFKEHSHEISNDDRVFSIDNE